MIYEPCDLSAVQQVSLYIYGEPGEPNGQLWDWGKPIHVEFPEVDLFTPTHWRWTYYSSSPGRYLKSYFSTPVI